MIQLQRDFESFKQEMTSMQPNKNSEEYNKLYEACLLECGKSQKFHRLYQQSEVRVASLAAEKAALEVKIKE